MFLGAQTMMVEDVRWIFYRAHESIARAGCNCVRERVVYLEKFKNKRLEFEVFRQAPDHSHTPVEQQTV